MTLYDRTAEKVNSFIATTTPGSFDLVETENRTVPLFFGGREYMVWMHHSTRFACLSAACMALQ